MFISDTAIKRPVLTVVAMMMLVVFGIVALFQLDTDEYPEIDAPVVVVAVPYPGASPDVTPVWRRRRSATRSPRSATISRLKWRSRSSRSSTPPIGPSCRWR
jgi:hypothetical protein